MMKLWEYTLPQYLIQGVLAIMICVMPLRGYCELETAEETVQKATDNLIAKLIEVRPLYEENQQQFFDEVEVALSPHIDFKRFARGVMSKYYRSASEADRQKFEEVLKGDLIRTYAKSLVEFDNEEIIVLPPEKGESSRPNESNVNLEVRSKDGAVYKIKYRMSSKSGSWKLINVVVEGINLGLIFRNQFLSLMDENRRNLELVIQKWKSEVKESE